MVLAHDNAKSLLRDKHTSRSSFVVSDTAGQKRANRWGNSSPSAFQLESTSHHDQVERSPPSQGFSPSRWECTKPSMKDKVKSPTPPERRSGTVSQESSDRRCSFLSTANLPEKLRELPY